MLLKWLEVLLVKLILDFKNTLSVFQDPLRFLSMIGFKNILTKNAFSYFENTSKWTLIGDLKNSNTG